MFELVYYLLYGCVLSSVTWDIYGFIGISIFDLRGSASYYHWSHRLIGLLDIQLVDLVAHNVIKRSALFSMCMSNCLHIRNSKIQTVRASKI